MACSRVIKTFPISAFSIFTSDVNIEKMPHLRKRYAEPALLKALSSSPLVGLLGHRQTGKTTLISELCDRYFSLDQKTERESAEADPKKFLNRIKKGKTAHKVALDECQWVPDLFPALKDEVRLSKKPGQYLLSGSVRFTSKKAIRESLAGRITLLELLPFTLRELLGEPPSTLFLELIQMADFSGYRLPSALPKSIQHERNKQIEKYLTHGGLPGICFIRKDNERSRRLNDLLDLILDRDLRQLVPTTLRQESIKKVLTTLALQQGEPLQYQDLSRATRVSVPTLKKIISALESLFLIRQLPLEGGRKGHIAYFEDQGEHQLLGAGKIQKAQLLEHYLWLQMRAQFIYSYEELPEFFQYRTRGGAIVPFAVRTQEGVLGFLWSPTEEPSLSLRYTAQSFLKTYSRGKIIIAHPGSTWHKFSDRILIVPASEF